MPRPISRRSRCVPFPLLTPLFGRFAPTRPPLRVGLPPPLAGEGWGGGNLWHEASHKSSPRRKPGSTFPLARAIQYGIIIVDLWATSAPRGAVGPGFRRDDGWVERASDGPIRNRAAGAALRGQAPPQRQWPLPERRQPFRPGLRVCIALAACACRDP